MQSTESPPTEPPPTESPPTDDRVRPDGTVMPTAQCIVGPDCGPPIRLAPGRHVIGRAPTACLRIDDASVELHHAILDVDDDGIVAVIQIGGRRPIVAASPSTTGPSTLADGATMDLGSTRVVIGRSAAGGVDGTVRHQEDQSVPVPAVRTGHPSMTAAIVAAATALAIGATIRLLGGRVHLVAIGAGIATLVATLIARRTHRGRGRDRDVLERHRIDMALARDEAVRTHRHRHRSLGDVLSRFDAGTIGPAIPTARAPGLVATLGIGDQRCSPSRVDRLHGTGSRCVDTGGIGPIDLDGSTGTLADVAVPWVAARDTTTIVTGPRHFTLALTRAVIVQLAMADDPPMWDLTVETSQHAEWEWAEWLAQARHLDGSPAIHPLGDHRARARVGASHDDIVHLLVIDDPHRSAHVSAHRSTHRSTHRPRSAGAAVMLIADGTTSPDDDDQTLVIGSTGQARWRHDLGGDPFAVAGLSAARATDLARRLALGVGPDHRPCGQPVDGSPSNHRGPAPNPAAASSVL